MLTDVFILFASLAILIISANYLINASIKIAQKWKVSEMFIGLTIVAMGTSAPELAVSVSAALKGQGDLSIGNVIGSNIFNLGIILGFVAIIAPQLTSKKIIKRDIPILFLATLLILFFMLDMKIVRWEGLTLMIILIIYIITLAIQKDAPSENVENNDEKKDEINKSSGLNYLIFILSLLILVKSSDFVVSSAVSIAGYFKISAWAIGATIIAAGTSLPEMTTSIIATTKKKFDLSIGNIVGSDIFNTFGIIGLSSIITPINLSSQSHFLNLPDSIISIILLIFTIILVFIFMVTKKRLSRGEGIILVTLAILRMILEVYIGKS